MAFDPKGSIPIDRRGFSLNNRVRAHRASYQMFAGNIPVGMFVCHKCDNPKCVNPAHLFLGSASDNALDCKKKGRSACGSKHGMAKLTEEQVLWAITQKKMGKSSKYIASELNVCISSVDQMTTGKTWKSVFAEFVNKT